MERIITNVNATRSRISRISWGAVLAGALTSITVLILLNLLGLGIGLTSIDPMTDAQPLDGVGTWTIIYWIVSNLAALFIGGMVAGRMSGLPMATDGGLHGFLAWGLHLIIGLFFLTSLVGSVLGGVGNLASSIFGGSDTQDILVNVTDAQKTATDDSNFSLDQVKNEILTVMRKAEKNDILPNDATEETNEAISETSQEVTQALDEMNIDQTISKFINDINVDLDNNGNLKITVDGNEDYIDEDGLKDYLVQNTSLSEKEINGLVERWNNKIDAAVQKAEELYSEAKEEALIASEKISDTVGTYSIYLFFLLLLGAGAAFAGGATGSPLLTVSEQHREDLLDNKNL